MRLFNRKLPIEWTDIPQEEQSRLILWYNIVSEHIEHRDLRILAKLYWDGIFRYWYCSKCRAFSIQLRESMHDSERALPKKCKLDERYKWMLSNTADELIRLDKHSIAIGIRNSSDLHPVSLANGGSDCCECDRLEIKAMLEKAIGCDNLQTREQILDHDRKVYL